MIVDKVLGARAVNLSHADRYSAGPGNTTWMHTVRARVFCAVHTQSRRRQNTQPCAPYPNTGDGGACQISARKIYIFCQVHLVGPIVDRIIKLIQGRDHSRFNPYILDTLNIWSFVSGSRLELLFGWS